MISAIFSMVEGLTIEKIRLSNRVQEIDLVIRNKNKNDVWSEFDGIIFVECKNWDVRVGSPEIAVFKDKLIEYGLKIGILIATGGITGKNYQGARGKIKLTLKEGIKIVVLDGNDILRILDCNKVNDVVDRAYIDMYIV